MTAADDLLRRIEAEPRLAALLVWPGDFDIARREPVEELRVPCGLALTPIAGDGAGGTYFLCGEPGGRRPVLFADSEGGATLVAEDLVEAITLIAAYPYWQDLGHGHTAGEQAEELAEDAPAFPVARARQRTQESAPTPTPEAAHARRSAAAGPA